MSLRHADSPDFVIRPLETPAERDAYYTLALQTFHPQVDAAEALPRRRRFTENIPMFQARSLRGAFLGNTLLGGCHVDERVMRIGSARLLTGCIGSVVTMVEHRNQGVAAALLRDVVTYAQEQHHALLLLDGIGQFYHRFGFIDVFDTSWHTIENSVIQAQAASPYKVRQATFEDIPALLALYQRHFAAYPASFERDKTFQERLFHDRGWMKPYLAVDNKNAVRGHLLLNMRPEKPVAYEVTADDWYAALALLQEHVKLVQDRPGEENKSISWPLPMNSQAYYLLSDHFQVKSLTTSTPDADWMARTEHLPTLIDALLPLWNERWQQHNPGRSGVLAITIENEPFLLGADAMGIHLLDPMTSSAYAARHVKMSQQVFIQLLFGYRSVSWAIRQQGQEIPEELQPVLDILFPQTPAWIAGSDAF